MLYFAISIELLAIAFLSFGMDWLWTKNINNKVLRIFMFPGSVAHVLSHALLCLITGATIRNLNIFTLENEIFFERPKIRFVGNFLIIVAPIFGCGIILLFFATYLGSSAGENQHIQNNVEWLDNAKFLAENVKSTLIAFWNEIKNHKIPQLIFFYLSVVFTVSMAPKKDELKYLFFGLLILAAIPFFLEMFGMKLKDNGLWVALLNGLWHLITLSITVLGALLAITLIIIGFVKGFRLIFSQKGKPHTTNKRLAHTEDNNKI